MNIVQLSSRWTLFLLLKSALQGHAAKKPHILFMVMDDLGSHDLGMHGTGIKTPNCDKLAADGTYLENYYVLPFCSATRSSIMTGKYPLHTGVHEAISSQSTNGLPLGEETLPQVLKKAGYKTHAVGKWHLGHAAWEQTPTFRGFDSFYGFYLGGQHYYTHKKRKAYDMRFDKKPNCGEGCSQLVDETGNYSTHVFSRESIQRIHEHKSEDDPLFLYLAFQSVHIPSQAPWSYVKPYRKELKPNWTYKRKKYAGMLAAADEAIGLVTEALEEAGMWNDTLVVFTTDNGGPTDKCGVQGSSNGVRRGGKCTIWEGGTTGDGFISGPYWQRLMESNKAKNGKVDQLFHCVDWLPTLADLLGTKTRSGLDGVSHLNYLLGNQTSVPREEFFVGYGQDMQTPAVRKGKWKLVEVNHKYQPGVKQKRRHKYSLYNIRDDPSESHDMAAEKRKVVRILERKMYEYKATLVPKPPLVTSCPYEIAEDSTFGPSWIPWCKELRFYGK